VISVRADCSSRRVVRITRRAPRARRPRRTRIARIIQIASRSPDTHFDLLRLRFFALRDIQGQHAILVVGLDTVRIHGVREREAAAERAIRPLDAQIIIFVNLLLEPTISADREDVVLDADVEISLLDLIQEIGDESGVLTSLLELHQTGGELGPPSATVRHFSRRLIFTSCAFLLTCFS
jgi:hypothetical protein